MRRQYLRSLGSQEAPDLKITPSQTRPDTTPGKILADPPAIHKNRAIHHLPCVVSEGNVWFGRKAPGGRAWGWLGADDANLQK